MTNHPSTIFTFWEPKGTMPAYLRLCRETWRRNSPGFNIVDLDYENVESWTEPKALDLDTLKRLRLASQKDAIQMAVLARSGGLFMDMDTIVLGDLSHLVRHLDRTELLMFNVHFGLAAARPEAKLVLDCLERVRHRLTQVRNGEIPLENAEWDFLSNSILQETMVDFASRNSFLTRIQGRILGGLAQALSHAGTTGESGADFFRRLDGYLTTRVVFKYRHRDKFLMLPRDRHEFIVERVHGNRRIRNPERKYLAYWFSENTGAKRPVPSQSAVIGLHNSWTPEWYSALSEAEVLDHPCLLSRTLKAALSPANRAE